MSIISYVLYTVMNVDYLLHLTIRFSLLYKLTLSLNVIYLGMSLTLSQCSPGVALMHDTNYVWVGGHDLLTEGTWFWSSIQQPFGNYTRKLYR